MPIDNQIASRHWRSRRAIPTTFRTAHPAVTLALQETQTAAQALGLAIQSVDVREPSEIGYDVVALAVTAVTIRRFASGGSRRNCKIGDG
jgi:hypothetical protein